jgi:hypothetical protein
MVTEGTKKTGEIIQAARKSLESLATKPDEGKKAE